LTKEMAGSRGKQHFDEQQLKWENPESVWDVTQLDRRGQKMVFIVHGVAPSSGQGKKKVLGKTAVT